MLCVVIHSKLLLLLFFFHSYSVSLRFHWLPSSAGGTAAAAHTHVQYRRSF